MSDRKVPSRIGRFEIKKELGRGAFGTVYLAIDPQLERPVALKVPHFGVDEQPKSITRFLREAKAAAGLHHPNIVAVHDAGRHDESFYIASAFVDGSSLREKMKADGKPSKKAAVKLVAKLANALGYANEQGVVHRDVKPENILLQKDCVPFLVDFGLARRDSVDVLQTQEGTVLGTPAYMSPEQASGHGASADGRTDQWSLGVILYELLTGVRPFAGNQVQIMYSIQHSEVASPRSIDPTIPLDLEIICLRCLSKDPKDRFPDNYELGRDLERWLNDEPIASRRLSIVERFSRWNRRNPTVARLSLALVASISLLGTGATIQWLRAEWNASQLRSSLAEGIKQQKTLEEQAGIISKRSSELESRNQELVAKNEALQKAKEEIAQSLLNLQKKEEVIQLTSQEKEVAVETAKIASAESAAEKQQRIEEQSKNRKLRYFGEIQSARLALASGDAALAIRTLDASDKELRSMEWDVLYRRASKYEKGFVSRIVKQEDDPVGYRFMQSVHFPDMAVEPAQIEELCKANQILTADRSATRWLSIGSSNDFLAPLIPGNFKPTSKDTPALRGVFVESTIQSTSLRGSADTLTETVVYSWLSPNGRYVACITPKTSRTDFDSPKGKYSVTISYEFIIFDLENKEYFRRELDNSFLDFTTLVFTPQQLGINWEVQIQGALRIPFVEAVFSEDSKSLFVFQLKTSSVMQWDLAAQSKDPIRRLTLPSATGLGSIAFHTDKNRFHLAYPGHLVSVDGSSLEIASQSGFNLPEDSNEGLCFSRNGRLIALPVFRQGNKKQASQLLLYVYDRSTKSWTICQGEPSSIAKAQSQFQQFDTPAERFQASREGVFQVDWYRSDLVADRNGQWLSFRHRSGLCFQFQRDLRPQLDAGYVLWQNSSKKRPIQIAGSAVSESVAIGFEDRVGIIEPEAKKEKWHVGATQLLRVGKFKELSPHPAQNTYFVSTSDRLTMFDPIRNELSPAIASGTTSSVSLVETGRILYADNQGQVTFASERDGTVQSKISVQRRATPAIALDAKNSFLAAAGEDRRIVLWDTRDMKMVGSVITDSPIRQLRFNPKSQLLAALGFDNSVTLFRWPSLQRIAAFPASEEAVLWYNTTDDGKRLLQATRRGITLADIEYAIQVLDVVQFAVPSVCLFIDGNQETAFSYDEADRLAKFSF